MVSSSEFINQFKHILENIGGDAYLVGGYVRDKLINSKIQPSDIDIIYSGDMLTLISEFKNLGYKFFPIKEDVGIYRCMAEKFMIDIAVMKGRTIEEDLAKRDFTINAICMKLIENRIIDPFNGRNAIKSRIIQNVSNESLEQDPVRILRGIRFYIAYGMHFSFDTENNIVKVAPRLKSCPKERVFNEFMKIIESDKDGKAFEFLDNYNILRNMFPYIDELKTVGKCDYHIEDAFTHMNLTYGVFKDILNKKISINGLDINVFEKKIGNFKLREYIAFACFMHDIGKFKCYKKTNEKVSFYGHDIEGARIVKLICESINFPKEAAELTEKVVEGHMYPLGLFSSKIKEPKKTFYKFFKKYEKFSIELIVLSFCDNYATNMMFDPKNEKEAYKEFIENMLSEYKRYIEIRKNRLISGTEIISFTGKQGPNIGSILDDIDMLRYLGKINSRENVIEYLDKNKI